MTDQEKKFVLLDPALSWRISCGEALYSNDDGLSIQRVPGEDKPLKDNFGNFGGLDYPSGLSFTKFSRAAMFTGVWDTYFATLGTSNRCPDHFS